MTFQFLFDNCGSWIFSKKGLKDGDIIPSWFNVVRKKDLVRNVKFGQEILNSETCPFGPNIEGEVDTGYFHLYIVYPVTVTQWVGSRRMQ